MRRMAKRKTKMSELTAVRLTPEIAAGIEDWRRAQPTIPGKGTAIRELVRLGLEFAKLKDGAKERKAK